MELAINSTVARSTGKVPFEVAYGDNVRLPMDFTLDTPVQVSNAGFSQGGGIEGGGCG